uniref:Uncharacterized protein LOC105650086 n=1 Tax=Rhizophora mucronata TaxID=61149 RepID=A0A2P2LJJ0_RHIMU
MAAVIAGCGQPLNDRDAGDAMGRMRRTSKVSWLATGKRDPRARPEGFFRKQNFKEEREESDDKRLPAKSAKTLSKKMKIIPEGNGALKNRPNGLHGNEVEPSDDVWSLTPRAKTLSKTMKLAPKGNGTRKNRLNGLHKEHTRLNTYSDDESEDDLIEFCLMKMKERKRLRNLGGDRKADETSPKVGGKRDMDSLSGDSVSHINLRSKSAKEEDMESLSGILDCEVDQRRLKRSREKNMDSVCASSSSSSSGTSNLALKRGENSSGRCGMQNLKARGESLPKCHQCMKNGRRVVVPCQNCKSKMYCIQCIKKW